MRFGIERTEQKLLNFLFMRSIIIFLCTILLVFSFQTRIDSRPIVNYCYFFWVGEGPPESKSVLHYYFKHEDDSKNYRVRRKKKNNQKTLF